jgi:ABC-type cobalamin transport system ATPase subunit
VTEGNGSNGPLTPRLPRPERFIMRRFSLFDQTTSPDLCFNDGVFCLAGANGLGKSTFLAALAYAVTGVVAEPGRGFRDAEDYAKKTESYHRAYFRGRIDAEDAEAAEVELTMVIDDYRYRLVRGLFDTGQLRQLEVRNRDAADVIEDGRGLDAVGLHERYTELVVDHANLDSFEQLVFLQHFMMLFDERRHLLFWDEVALSNALYLAFGLDPAMARQADKLQADIRKQDSLSRNYGWQASDVRRRLQDLRKTGEEVAEQAAEEDDELVDREHRELTDAHDEAVHLHERVAKQITDVQLDISVRSSTLRAVRAEYDALWSQRLQGHGHPSSHPLVTTTLADERCALCGTPGDAVTEHVQSALRRHHCPLCDSALAEDGASGAQDKLAQLQALDSEIATQQEKMLAAESLVDRLEAEQQQARSEIARLARELADFEQRNAFALMRRDSSPEGLEAVAAVYEAQIAERLARQAEARKKRDAAKTRIEPLRRELRRRYAVAQEQFVPRFERLAHEFLGLDLDVEFATKAHKATLQLTVAGQRRREDITLSESQRFFVDIAELQEVRPSLLLDTPEGSLDIAYEAKAGSMISLFAREGHGIIMTANINTSELLVRLASECGPDGMTLERMTTWASLSEVQEAEEKLFTQAYDRILEALRTGGR